jgi:hypothetical protein
MGFFVFSVVPSIYGYVRSDGRNPVTPNPFAAIFFWDYGF